MQETYQNWSLISLSHLDVKWIILCLVGICISVGMVLYSYRNSKQKKKMIFLRILSAFLIAIILIEPVLQISEVQKLKNEIIFIIDRSQSMNLKDENNQKRYEYFLKILKEDNSIFEELAQSHIIKWYDLKSAIEENSLYTEPTDKSTDLIKAIENTQINSDKLLSSIILITDGADNVNLNHKNNQFSLEAIEYLKNLKTPVNTIDVTRTKDFKDITIMDIKNDEFAFLHNTLVVDVDIYASGFDNIKVPITLYKENELIITKEVILKKDHTTRVNFEIKPDQLGEFIYDVVLPVSSGDSIPSNNTRSFVLQVIRDKMRVLQVAGRPSFDVRFLRQHLKENPNVDLISFFILRTPEDIQNVPEKELSLIPFPVKKLFTTELQSFDVIIFQNFDYIPYRMARYLPNIKEAIKNGLGFVMLGGEHSFGKNYQNSPLKEIIPFNMETHGIYDRKVEPVLTEFGIHHPVMDLTHSRGSNIELWKRLPYWTSENINAGLVLNATALLVNPAIKLSNNTFMPLIAVMDVGLGRSIAIATDSLWRFRLSHHQNNTLSERAYHRFWSNTLRWLVRDPEHSNVQIKPSKYQFDIEEPVQINIHVLGKDYRPISNANVRVILSEKDGNILKEEHFTTQNTGIIKYDYTDLKSGSYKIQAEAKILNSQIIGKDSSVFIVKSTSLEFKQAKPRRDLMKTISTLTKGKYLPLKKGFLNDIEMIDPKVIETQKKRHIELWDNIWVMLILVSLLATEWYIRRRNGYI